MRTLFGSMAVFCCVSGFTIADACAQDPAPIQCSHKADLTDIGVALSRVDYMAGPESGKVSDDVMMIDFVITVRNAGAVDAGRTRLRYAVDIRAPGGDAVQSAQDTMDIYSVRAGATEESLVSVMVDALGSLVQPDGVVSGTALLRIEVDVDDEVAECDEADNKAEIEAPFSTEKVVN